MKTAIAKMHSKRDTGAGIMYLYLYPYLNLYQDAFWPGRWCRDNVSLWEMERHQFSPDWLLQRQNIFFVLLVIPFNSSFKLTQQLFTYLGNRLIPHLDIVQWTTSNFRVYNFQLPCVQPPTSLCTTSNIFVYNLQLPCVQPPTSLCTTSNIFVYNIQLPPAKSPIIYLKWKIFSLRYLRVYCFLSVISKNYLFFMINVWYFGYTCYPATIFVLRKAGSSVERLGP